MKSTSPVEVELESGDSSCLVIGHVEWVEVGVEEDQPSPTTVIDEVYEAEVKLTGWPLAAFVAVHGTVCRERIEQETEALAERFADRE